MHRSFVRGSLKRETTMHAGLKTWRESSSIILVAKTAFTPGTAQHDFNYKLLTTKRSDKSGYMPGTYVFPGGNLSPADASRDWLKLYESFGFKFNTFDKLNLKENRPKLFCNNTAKELPRFLSLRIGAIREAFEECGILICRSFKINYKERAAWWASSIESPIVKRWQNKIHENSEHFLDMCHTFEIYPDVWALKEWSNWVTPSPMPRRFDTAFFLTAFNQTPSSHADDKEVQHLEWSSPTEYIERNKQEQILLPPPQFYEISRLRNFLDIDNLLKFASERSTHGIERYIPLRVKTDEGIFTILPGDDLYEIDEKSEKPKCLDKLPDCDIQNRIHHKTQYLNVLRIANFSPKFNHVLPVTDNPSKIQN